MRKYLVIFIVIIVTIILFAWNIGGRINAGTSIGDGATWPGCVQITLDNKKYDLSENVKFNISYGHDYQYDVEEYGVISHNLVVYIIDGSQTSNNPENGIILYEDNITGDDLLSEDYRCDPGKWIFSKVEYNNDYELSVDFSEFDFDNGVLVIRFYETYTAQDNIDGEIIYTEITHYNGTQIFFIKDDLAIEFSERSFG
ncbi:hypothetical protein RJI07_06145 [Mycoplasmatota bacterium WC30]